ncbi:carboxypeptidase regulatory-like domain-containing protein [uncultured Paludibaculum sp.]|uniref:carboxypeptidase regulatory-like domain-containing protein n=1 Tax=uncultured Paludibaculum sp. TaxID=1765020 RepID=UPI002AAAACB9|nr:carboxypeptidase regulatory-like domain-containing protein [uncultured Paludibaculum sp.]
MMLSRVVIRGRFVPILTLLPFLCLTGWAQQITGTISGNVKDAQQAAVAGAKVTIISTQQGTTREVSTNNEGTFVFTNAQPGTYDLGIEAPGFKKFEQKGVVLYASDRLSLGDLTLSVGALTETVTVEGDAAQVQATSAERSGVLTNKQVVDLALTSRNLFDLAKTIPGVVYTGSGVGAIAANGNRNNQNNFTLDGVTNMDTGSNGGTLASTNMDMIADMKIVTNSQGAEFGRASGAQIQVVTKSGTQQFHGTGYGFHRHEGLNANTWRNNIDNRARPFYRYNFAGFNIGGPAYIPGKFNKDKEKFFFFVGIEWQNQLVPNNLSNVTVPTALERQGDFSQSHDAGGAALVIKDPANGGTQFPNNQIPASRLNADGVKILNFYPSPNALGVDNSFNYQSQASNKYPRREDIYRGDYNISDKWKVYARYINNKDETSMAYGQWNAQYNIPFGPMSFGAPGWSFVSNVTTIINPTLTNEFLFGSSKNVLHIFPLDNAFDRGKLNLSYKMPYPTADTLNLVQNWQWDVPNSPSINFTGTPFSNYNHTYDITDSVAKVWGSHTIKTGIYINKSAKDQTSTNSVNGYINFNRDVNNPGDTNWSWSNALLGNYNNLQQSNKVLNGQYRSLNVEWYVQDNWKVNSKLTLEYGIRFYYIQPQYDDALQTSSWNRNLWDPTAAGVLRTAALNSSGARISVNPITGETGPAALIGSLVNTGKGFVNGVYANGMGLAGQNYPKGLLDGRGLQYAPRVGLAYRLMNKTVLRAGGGVFYDRLQGNPIFDMLVNPPSIATPKFYYGNLASIPAASAGIFFPGNVNGFDKSGNIPTTYNWNFTIQRELPYNILFDIAYVGSSSNHLLYRLNQNALPLGSAWAPQNQDPLKTPLYDGTTTNAPNFYRGYQGYGNAIAYGFGANSNYHAMQMSANRRLGNDFTFGVAYTWSKAMGTTNDDYTTITPFNFRTADYAPLNNDRTHVLVLNYVYNLPKFIKGTSGFAKVGKFFTNEWQISGITTMQTGAPNNITFSIDGVGNLNERYTGSTDVGPRVVYTASPSYPKSLNQYIDGSVLALPTIKGSQGFDSSRYPVRQPTWTNWDVSIFKNIPIHESMRLQLRCEMFNAPNHPEFNDYNRSATFNSAGKLINLPTALGGTGGRFGFGAVTGTLDPRRIQLAAKFYF